MITVYKTRYSEFHVDPVAKTVSEKGAGYSRRYEFMSRQPDGGLYFHAFDSDTGTLRPIITSQVIDVSGS